MRVFVFVLCAAVAPAALAEPLADPQRAWAAQVQAERQRRLERAQARCIENRGVDCTTEEGLQEWLLLDRSRAEAVLDRIVVPPQLIVPPSASAGASAPAAPARAGGQ